MTLTEYNDIEQGTPEWYELRRGMLTASVIGQLVTPKTMQVANNPDSRAIVAQLAAERITDWADDNYVSYDMQRGHDDEPRAREFYATQTGHRVIECGFMVREFHTGPTCRIGYSPDGLVVSDGLIEVKSRVQKKQVATVLAGGVPAEHVAQVQAGLFVSGRNWCDYISWCGGMAFWVVRVYPDPQWQAVIVDAVIAAEKAITQMVNDYRAAVDGLPVTERTVMEVVI